MSDSDEQAVIAATEGFYAALNAMFAGDPTPLSTVYSHADDVSYMPAEGGFLVGWDQVFADWSRQAQASRGGSAEAESIRAVVGQDLAISQALTNAMVQGADGEIHRNQVRETSAFRKERGEWKMISHHADAIQSWEAVVDGE
jgi:ketosteroid isomerase-like protein